MLCTVTNDSTIGSFQLKIEEGIKENSVSKISVYSKISNEVQALCAAWSPKGKQVAIGCKNGDIVQLKPDTLKIARIIAGPSPSIGEVISILWISNYQFCAAYSNNERHINVLIIDAPKGETSATFTCYEDITYGCVDAEEEENILRYYFEYIPEWGFIIAGSSTSSEIAVLGTTDGGINWNQWQLVDNGRAQLPLMRTTEIYPMGLAVDKSPTNILPWGTDSSLLYPVPILHILGTSGRLCSFHMVNLMPNCPAINSPPTEIVPIPIPSQPIVSHADISFSMNAAVTSTPRPKQSEIMPERPKPAAMTNIFGESLKTAGFFQHAVEQTTEQPKPQEEKSTLITNAKSVTSKEILESESPKPEIKLAVDKGISSSQIIEQKAAIDDSIRMRAFLQEQMMFEKELRNRLQPQVWECGTDEEKKRLGETSAIIEQFLRDLKDTINSLSSDIAYLKALLLQSFAWIEETKSKNAASADITSRNCSENSKITNLQRWYYYTQTQLNQVSKILDLEWSEHKAQKKTKMKIPSLEFVYQNLLIHNKIFAKEKEKFEQILRQWKSLNRSLPYTINVSSLNRSMVNLHVSSPKLSVIRGKTDIIDARCKTIASKTLNFTHEKQVKLKALLIESHPRIVKPVNPSPIQDRLKATLSSLASLNPAEIKAKTEPSLVKQSIIVNKQIEKPTKSQNPLASLNSIVARIGSSDTSGIVQNKTQQKSPFTTVSFSTTISTKQIDKKSVAATSAVSQPKLKQDLGISFPSSITFGISTQKSQDTLFSKSALIDATSTSNKEITINDNISKVPESVLFSTGILKDALSTEYPLNTETTRMGIVHNLPSLSIAPVIKMDNAATFNFATSNIVPNLVKNTPSHIVSDTMSVSKSMTNTSTVELPTTTTQLSMQAPIELSTLSSVLGSSSSLTLPSNNADGKINMMTSTSFAVPVSIATTQTSAMTAIATPTTNIGDITVNTHLVSTNSIRKSTQITPAADTFIIEKVTTPEVKAPNFGSISAQVPNSLSATPIFGGQTIAKNISEVTTTTATTTFSATVFPSIAPTFGISTVAPTASVFSGFTNTSTGIIITPISSTASINNTMSPFQSSLNKPMFSETTVTSMPTTNFSINSSNTSAGTISFSPTTTTSITATMTTTIAAISPTFCKNPIVTPISNAQFPNAQTPASSANIFGKSIISPASTPFGNTSSSVFSNMPVTSSSTSIFGGSSINSVFGSSPLSSTSGNIFGGNSARFGAPTSGSIFDTNAPKSGIMFGGATSTASASPFGNATSNTSPMAAGVSATANVFSSTVTNTSPIQQPVLSSQSTFGQAPTFGTKPVFGSSPIFGGSKPVFGGNSFGSSPTFESSGIGK
jgi:nuclear pore complex protein Nup214